jgi:uncharacterized SAM-binding protein YcdF (DUF218 family)
MFFIKKVMAPFFMPVSAVLLLALVGLFCLWFTRRQKMGKLFVTAAVALLGLMSYGQVADMVAGPLEVGYRPIVDYGALKDVKWVVVLSGGASVDPELPLSTYLSEACLRRLFEGVHIHKRIPGSKLILTGRSAFEGVTPIAEFMADVAKEWGVKPEDIVVEAEAKDTRDHAVFVKEIVGDDRFVLVTSASHMPRAMALFWVQGMEPIVAPTDYMVKEREGGGLRPGDFFPSARALEKAERAVHEYLGLVWGKIRGQIRYAKDV